MGRRVLLIEDEPHIAEAIGYILTRDGWTVAAHRDGLGALDAIRDVRPDVIVLDVMLPGRSGFEILADLRADPDLRRIKVLMLTAAGLNADRETALRAGADDFMSKPFANAELVAAMRALGDADE